MRTATLGLVLTASIVGACLVDRPSAAFECSTQADCSGERTCVSGYCVISATCPSDCTSCNAAAKTCQVDCTSADDCGGTIDCPFGWNCTINCIGGGACNNVVCASGSKCSINCSGAGSCDAIDCDSACSCDLQCAAGACSSMSCPVVGNGTNLIHCTADGTVNTPCESAHDASCTKC